MQSSFIYQAQDTMPCIYCNMQFTVLKCKTRCQSCAQSFCSNCTVEKTCYPCRNVLDSQWDYERLMKVKVKDLKIYLSSRDLPVKLCKEKRELVHTILRHHNVSWIQPENVHVPYAQMQRRSNPPDFDSISRGNRTSSSEGSHILNASSYVDTASMRHRTPRNVYGTREENGRHAAVTRPVATGWGNKILLTDLTIETQIDSLSPREMKQILADNFVDYRDCVEKSELHARLKNLFLDKSKNEYIGPTTEENDENICKICWDSPADCVLLECGHMVTCTACGKKLNECPICRRYIARCVHVFKS